MRKFYILSVAALVAASFAMVAGSALAQDDKGYVRFKGYAMSGFGQLTDDPGTPGSDSLTSWYVDSQAQIEARGGVGPVTARYRLRVREGTRKDSTSTTVVTPGADGIPGNADDGTATVKVPEAFAAVRHNVTWKVTDAFELRFDGQGFGTNYSLNSYNAHSVGNFGDGAIIGDKTPQGLLVNVSGVDATFKVGAMEVGVFLLDECNPGCSGSVEGDQTLIPHFFGKFGPLDVAFFTQMAEGTAAAGAGADPESDLTSVSARYKAGSMDLGFEYVTAEFENKDEYTSMGLGGSIGAIQFHYVTSEDTPVAAGAFAPTETEIVVDYKMTLTEKAHIVFGYVILTEEITAAVEREKTYLVASIKTDW